jgi:hypothetical protein
VISSSTNPYALTASISPNYSPTISTVTATSGYNPMQTLQALNSNGAKMWMKNIRFTIIGKKIFSIVATNSP